MFKKLVRNGQYLLEKQNSSILSAATIIMFATLFSALLGVIRTRLLISYFYHSKTLVDVFWASFRLPDMIFQIIIVSTLSSAFIPLFTQSLRNLNSKTHHSNLVASTIISTTLILMFILSIIIFIYADHISSLIGRGFTQDQLIIMVGLTRIMILAQLLFGFSSFLTGVIQSYKRFLIPALSPILYNLGITIGIVKLGPHWGIYGPAWGVVLGSLFHLLIQLPLAYKLGFRYHLTISNYQHTLTKLIHLVVPRTLTLSLIQIEQTAIIMFSSLLSSGTVTMMAIAQQLSGLPIRLIGIPIGQASLPFLSHEVNSGNLKRLAKMVNRTILEMLYLALPASAILLVLRIPLVRLAYGTHSFPWKETVTTAKLVAILAISVSARSLAHVIVRVYYALRNTKTPLLINLIATILNISLSYYLIIILKSGVIGMAFAITLASISETVLLVFNLYHLAQFKFSALINPLLKMIVVTLISTLFLWIPLRFLDQLIFDTTRTLPLIILTFTVTIIGISVYLLLSYIFHIPELYIFVKLFHKLGNWHKALAKATEPLESSESSV